MLFIKEIMLRQEYQKGTEIYAFRPYEHVQCAILSLPFTGGRYRWNGLE